MSVMFKVQESIFTALTNNVTFMGSVQGLYDQPPVNAKYPYVTIGSMSELSNNRLSVKGFTVTADIEIYTKTGRGGTKQSKEILEKMNDVLNLKILPITGFTMVQIYYISSVVNKSDDITNISASFEIIIH